MQSIKPPKLQVGDAVAVVSTSSGAASRFSHVYEQGLRNLSELFGLRVIEYPTARMTSDDLQRQPQLRAEDLNTAFADSEVKAIIASIGGDDSVRLLPYLDASVALENPKILMGYSDTATQLAFYNQHGLVTFNGPSVMAGFAQVRNVSEQARLHIEKLLLSSFDTYEYTAFPQWHNNYANWGDLDNTSAGTVGPARVNDGARWLQGEGSHSGRLFGGCIEVLDFLKGTDYWPDKSFWDDRVLFLETSEEKPSVAYVQRWLRNAGVQGLFDRVSGLLFGRARDYSDEEKTALDLGIQHIVAGEFGAAHLPIVTNLDFGHTDPQWIMPLGVPLQIDCERATLTLLESPTA